MEFVMPSLIIHTDQSLNNIIEELDFKKIEEALKQIIIKILDAEEDKCQIIWINSRIITSDYKIYCELKFRETNYRNEFKRKNCLDNIGEIIKKHFKVKVRLRSFAINQSSITALDI
jgi:hypothetical protein